MAQTDHDHDDNDDAHAHHGGHDGAHVPYDEAQVVREITADRKWMFGKFIQWSAWNLVLIFAVLILLALTQT